MAELVVKKWQLGRVLTAKKHGKSRILRIQSHILRIQTHVLRIQSHKQAHYRAQVTRLPRCKNNITAARKWSAHAAVIYMNYDVNNIFVLRNAFEKTRKQMKVNALSGNALSDNLIFPMFAKLTLKKT